MAIGRGTFHRNGKNNYVVMPLIHNHYKGYADQFNGHARRAFIERKTVSIQKNISKWKVNCLRKPKYCL